MDRIETPRGPVSVAVDGDGGGPVLAMAHGAGGDLHGPFLAGFARGLAAAGVTCLRFNFRYSEEGKRAPDRHPALREVWSAAFAEAGAIGGPVWVGGKSMGGRIASMMVADGELDAAGLVFAGYPLHAPATPDQLRDEHLYGIAVPMLFIQGTNDAFAKWDRFEPVLAKLGKAATLHTVDGGDHSFRVRGRPKDDAGTGTALGEVAARFILGGGS